MTVATVITAGFGSFGTVNLVVTYGYGATSPAPAASLYGFGFLEYDKRDIETLKEHYRKTEAARLRGWKAAEKARNDLSQAIRTIVSGKPPEAVQRIQEAVLIERSAEPRPKSKSSRDGADVVVVKPNWALIARDRANVERLIAALEFEASLNVQRAMQDDEDDVETILLSMH